MCCLQFKLAPPNHMKGHQFVIKTNKMISINNIDVVDIVYVVIAIGVAVVVAAAVTDYQFN